MHKAESKRFHEAADMLWEEAKKAREAGFFELEEALKELVEVLHSKGSGRRTKLDPVP